MWEASLTARPPGVDVVHMCRACASSHVNKYETKEGPWRGDLRSENAGKSYSIEVWLATDIPPFMGNHFGSLKSIPAKQHHGSPWIIFDAPPPLQLTSVRGLVVSTLLRWPVRHCDRGWADCWASFAVAPWFSAPACSAHLRGRKWPKYARRIWETTFG